MCSLVKTYFACYHSNREVNPNLLNVLHTESDYYFKKYSYLKYD